MSPEVLIPILIFVFLLIVLGVLVVHYDDEVRGLFPRLQKIRADRKGFESTFLPAQENGSTGLGPGAAPVAENDDASGFASPEADDSQADLQGEEDVAKFHNEMVTAAVVGNFERAEEALERIRKVEPDAVEVSKSEAAFSAFRFLKLGESKDFESLRAKATNPAVTVYVERLTGMVLRNLKRPAEAAEAYRRGSEAAEEPQARAKLLASWAEMMCEIGQSQPAQNELRTALASADDPSVRATLWRALGETYDARGEYFKKALALQEVRGHEPTDGNLCFSIGWAFSQSGREDLRPLAIHFYRLAIYLDSHDQFALNNLGWEYSKAGMPIEAAKYFKRAADLGNTLAMANLAGVKLDAGLADEAKQLLDAAGEQADTHENVAGLSAEVARRSSEQGDTAAALDQRGKVLAEFCVEVTQAEAQSMSDHFSSQWEWDSGEPARVEALGEALEIHWVEGKKKRRLEAHLEGKAGSGSVYEMGTRYSYVDEEEKETDWEKEESVLLVVDDDGRGIRLAILKEDGATFRSLRPS